MLAVQISLLSKPNVIIDNNGKVAADLMLTTVLGTIIIENGKPTGSTSLNK